MKLSLESNNATITRNTRCIYFLIFFSLLGFAIPAQAQFFERFLRDFFNYDPPVPNYDSIDEFIAEEIFDCGLVFFRDLDNIIDLGFCDETPTAPPPDPTTPSLPTPGQFATFESGQVRPLALSPDGSRLYAVNTPDSRVEIFDVTSSTPVLIDSVLVGLEPVALALGNNNELWVVNHLSDSVSIIDLTRSPAVVKNTLLVGDEPRDIVFSSNYTSGSQAPGNQKNGHSLPRPTADRIFLLIRNSLHPVWDEQMCGSSMPTRRATPLTIISAVNLPPFSLCLAIRFAL